MQWKRFGGAFIDQAAFEGWLTKLSSKLGVVCAASDEWAVEAVSRFFLEEWASAARVELAFCEPGSWDSSGVGACCPSWQAHTK